MLPLPSTCTTSAAASRPPRPLPSTVTNNNGEDVLLLTSTTRTENERESSWWVVTMIGFAGNQRGKEEGRGRKRREISLATSLSRSLHLHGWTKGGEKHWMEGRSDRKRQRKKGMYAKRGGDQIRSEGIGREESSSNSRSRFGEERAAKCAWESAPTRLGGEVRGGRTDDGRDRFFPLLVTGNVGLGPERDPSQCGDFREVSAASRI